MQSHQDAVIGRTDIGWRTRGGGAESAERYTSKQRSGSFLGGREGGLKVNRSALRVDRRKQVLQEDDRHHREYLGVPSNRRADKGGENGLGRSEK